MDHPRRCSRNRPSIIDLLGISTDEMEIKPPADKDRILNVRNLALTELPSRNINIPHDIGATSGLMRRRMSTVEAYKMRRNSVNVRKVTLPDIDAIVEVLLAKGEPPEAILQDIKLLNATLEFKILIKDQALKGTAHRKISSFWSRNLVFSFIKIPKMSIILEVLGDFCTPWERQMKKIRGHFGSEIASYFLFLRWLLYLNIWNLFIIMCFIFIPQSADFPYQIVNSTAKSDPVHISDLITGAGGLEATLLYYGQYSSEKSVTSEYNMPLAYSLTMCVLYMFNLAIIAKCLSSAYKNSYVFTLKMKRGIYNTVFCSWDYRIESENMANLRKEFIYQELVDIARYVSNDQVLHKTARRWLRFLIILFINILAAGLTVLAGFLLYYTLHLRTFEVNIPILNLISVPMAVTIIALSFHHLFSFLFRFEEFGSNESHLYCTIVRIAVMRCLILGIWAYFSSKLYIPEPGNTKCYENLQGSEIYRLIVLNFLVITFMYNVLLYLWQKIVDLASFLGYNLGLRRRFDVAFHTNFLIYYQTLVWMGMFYCPLLPLLLIVVLILVFYITLHSVEDNLKPSKVFWSIDQTEKAYLSVTIMCFLLSTIYVAYIVFYKKPSSNCGPFVGQDTVFSAINKWWERLTLEHAKFGFVINLIKAPSLLFSILVALCVATYYAKAYAESQEQIHEYINHLLVHEGQDKVLLLNLYEQKLSYKTLSTDRKNVTAPHFKKTTEK